MAGMRLSDLDFVRLLPAFMRDDESIIALSSAVDSLIRAPCQHLDILRTWDKIDELTETECDELAWELDVDWYDSTGMSLDQKRETLKLAQQIKRKRGTKWSVERLITAYFGEGYVMEWFETDADPYTFVALTTNPNITAENYSKFVNAVKAAKNERSHLSGVFYYWPQGPDPGIAYALGNSLHRYNFRKCGTCPRRKTLGALVKPGIEANPEETSHRYSFPGTGSLTCGTYPRPGTTGSALKKGICTSGSPAAYAYGFDRKAGTYPYPGLLGQAIKPAVQTPAEAAVSGYRFQTAGSTDCGTYPKQATYGLTAKQKTATAPTAAIAKYSFARCGTRRCGQK